MISEQKAKLLSAYLVDFFQVADFKNFKKKKSLLLNQFKIHFYKISSDILEFHIWSLYCDMFFSAQSNDVFSFLCLWQEIEENKSAQSK